MVDLTTVLAYEAGYKAGLERAAKLGDELAKQYTAYAAEANTDIGHDLWIRRANGAKTTTSLIRQEAAKK